MGYIIGLTVVLLIFGSIPTIIIYQLYSRHKERMDMLNRGVNPAQFASPPSTVGGNITLLLGLLSLFMGLAFAVTSFTAQRHFDRDLMTAGVIFIFIGAAFISYWKLTAEGRNRARKLQEEHYEWLLEQAKRDLAPSTAVTPENTAPDADSFEEIDQES